MRHTNNHVMRGTILACLTLHSSLLLALTGSQTISLTDLVNYQKISDPVAAIDLSNATLTINSIYGLNNEPVATFAAPFQGVGLARGPKNIIVNGNLTAGWQAIINGNALDLKYSPKSFSQIGVKAHFTSLSGAIDALANNTSYHQLVTDLRSSSSVAGYESKLAALEPMPSINNDVAAVQDLVIGKVEQRLVELYTQPALSYTAGSFFGNNLWLKPFVMFGKQQTVIAKNIQQYKTLIIGGTLGLDELNLNNTKSSGVSVSISKMKLYKYLDGDSSKAYNLNALIYGKYVNKNSVFMQWISGLGVSYAQQSRQIVVSNINETAHSHNKWYVGSLQFTSGYQLQNKNILFKPGIGVLYTYNHNEGYQENSAPLTGLFVHPRDRHNAYAFAIIDISNILTNPENSFAVSGYAKLQCLLTSPKQSYFSRFGNVAGTDFKSYSNLYRMQYKFGGNIKYTKYDAYDAIFGVDYNMHNAATFKSLTLYLKVGWHF